MKMLHNYEDDLKAAGVPLIRREDLSIKSTIALGRPFSGDVYLAEWTKPDKSKVRVACK